jgi:hypothetical protein
MTNTILAIRKEISLLQEKQKQTNLNKKNKKRNIKQKIQKKYNRIRGLVNEIHKKGAKYLCENFKTILIPKFETRPMLSKKKYQERNAAINEIVDEN